MPEGPIELRDEAVARRWLAAGLCTMRLERPTPAVTRRVAPWLEAVLIDDGALPPAGVVADLGALLLGGGEATHALPLDEPRLRAIVRAYESEILGRLRGEPRMQAASDAVARLPKELHPGAVSVFVSSVLARLELNPGVSVQPGVVRRFAAQAAEQVVEDGLTAMAQESAAVEALVAAYTSLVRASRHVAPLVTEADVFVLEHLAVLRTRGQRLEVAQVADVAAQLNRTLPKRMRRQSTSGRVPTAVDEEARYPVGGFSSIETNGSLENLVTSELVYMNDDDQRAAGESDLFEIRYVEGELLYYRRDESVLVREQRVFTFVLHPELTRARFKDRDVSWQRLVIVLGLLLCLVQRLTEWLNEAGLQFRIVFVHDETLRLTPLGPERELCELLLSEWIGKGVASVIELPSWREVADTTSSSARTAQSDVLSFVAARAPNGVSDQRVRHLLLDVSAATPMVLGASAVALQDTASTWASWIQTTGVLARTLL